MLVEQEGEEFLAAEERIRASARLSREIGDPTPRAGGRAASCRPGRAGRDAAGVRDSTSSSRTPPSSTTGSGGGARSERGRRRRASRSPRRSSAWPRLPADELVRGGSRDVSLELVLTAHPTEATRRTLLRAHVRIAGLLTRLDDPDLTRGRARRARGRARRGDHDPLADRRGAQRAAARRRRDPARALVLRGEPVRRRRAAAPRLPGARARGTPLPFSFGSWIGGDLDGNPEVGRRRSWRRSSGRARRRSRATAPTSARSRSRSRSSGSLVGVSAELEESIARDARECPAAIDDAGADDDRRALPAEALVHVVAARERRLRRPRGAARRHRASSGAASRRTAASGWPTARSPRSTRRVELFGFHLAKLDVRLHATEVRDADRAHARGVRGGRSRARAGTARRRSTR